ncbi:MAG: hypothetical protein ABI647_00135 [Gemmatimonadota bacterium]
MVRSVVGFAGFAVIFLLGLKLVGFLLGGLLSIVGSLLWFAFLGWIFYIILRVLSPSTADRVREAVRGKPSEA